MTCRGASLWSGAGLLLLFGFLASFDYYMVHNPPSSYHADDALLAELQSVKLEEKPRHESAAGDWPQWRGPRRDGVSLETGLLTDWPAEGLPVVWRTPCGEGYSCVVVSGTRAFTLWKEKDEEVVVCLDAATGEELWRLTYPAAGKIPYGSAPRSTPTIDGDRIYTVSAAGLLHCLNATTGEVVWQKDLLQEFGAENVNWGTSFSPLVEGDLLLTQPGGPAGQSIAALNKHTGATVWSALDDTASYSSPIAVTMAGVRQLVFFTGEALVGLAPDDGTLYWRYPWPTHDRINVATPIAHGNYLFLSSGYQKGCALLKVLRDGDGLRVDCVYQTQAMCNHFSTCVLYDEHLYGFTDPGVLACMSFRSGAIQWRERGYGRGSLIAAAGHLIVLDERGGQLALVEATPQGHHRKGVCPIPERRCWTAPTLAHGRLYLRTEVEIICFDVARQPRRDP